ncbi:MAG: SDR family oxidoreductase [Acidimicrobiia bacterium]|nr:SDR family oxidoreductase [Acidimicrobiia bacterium]MYG58508.1 SDR family oxidoreductase [Acidimicrobiia bacterium]MYJ33758.1 SDR family oxidoreductase [Acidimicrobiia bacterium]
MGINFDFSDRTVFITGGAQGIGAALVETFHGAGARVAAIDLEVTAIKERWADSKRVLPLACDVSDPAQCDNAIAATIDWSGAIDVLVNNAGITRDTVVWKLTDEAWSTVLDVHLTGTFNLTRAAIPHMRAQNRGRIVNVTSFTGLHGNIGQANYAAAKAGIIGFSKTVAKEVARFGITVNVVSPNAETPMVAAVPPEKKAELTAMVPLGRFGEPAEMAAGVAFLASDEAAYITGAVVPIDGGLSM